MKAPGKPGGELCCKSVAGEFEPAFRFSQGRKRVLMNASLTRLFDLNNPALAASPSDAVSEVIADSAFCDFGFDSHD
jgi:hypothetical protein